MADSFKEKDQAYLTAGSDLVSLKITRVFTTMARGAKEVAQTASVMLDRNRDRFHVPIDALSKKD